MNAAKWGWLRADGDSIVVVTTLKRGPKKPGRHQWYYCRPGGRSKHRRTRGQGGLVICLRRGCVATRHKGVTIGLAECL